MVGARRKSEFKKRNRIKRMWLDWTRNPHSDRSLLTKKFIGKTAITPVQGATINPRNSPLETNKLTLQEKISLVNYHEGKEEAAKEGCPF